MATARALLIALAMICAYGCGNEDTTGPEIRILASEFSGSLTCVPCHLEIHTIWAQSGHPYSLSKIAGETVVTDMPEFSCYSNEPVGPPPGYTWNDFTYVVGGYGWKMVWIDAAGFVLTSGAAMDSVRYFYSIHSWTTYGFGYEKGTKPFARGQCHATGWVDDEDTDTDGDVNDNQDGLQGVHGSFFAGGVHCEECHGTGSLHVFNPEEFDLIVDSSSGDCGRCHTRDRLNRIAAWYRFILPNAQYDEWRHSAHAIAAGPGCNDCHMPYAVKSAGNFHPYRADMRTHLVNINPEPVGRQEGMGLTGDLVTARQDPTTGMVDH